MGTFSFLRQIIYTNCRERKKFMIVLVIRTALLFSLVVFAIRVMGKRQMGEMQASELVVTLMISNVATIPMQDIGTPLLTGVMPILTLVLLELTLSFLMLKNGGLRHIVSGKPVVVIAKGKIDQKAMRMIRFSNEDLFEELRKNGIFDVSEVDYAVVETDGVLSVLQKNENKSDNMMYAMIINDGKIEKNSMELVSWSSEDVKKILQSEKTKPEDIYIMVASENKDYRIVRKDR